MGFITITKPALKQIAILKNDHGGGGVGSPSGRGATCTSARGGLRRPSLVRGITGSTTSAEADCIPP